MSVWISGVTCCQVVDKWSLLLSVKKQWTGVVGIIEKRVNDNDEMTSDVNWVCISNEGGIEQCSRYGRKRTAFFYVCVASKAG